MCHNSSIENEQIDRFVAYGMPQKVIKSVKYTIRKRHKADNEKRRRREKEEEAVIIAAAAAAAPIETVTEMITETANINENNALTETTATENATATETETTPTKKDNTIIISANTTNTAITPTTVNDSANGLYEASTSSLSSLSSSSSLSSLSSGQNASKSNSSKVDVVKETTTVVAVTETNEEPTKVGTELKLEKIILTVEKHNETNKSEEILSKPINMQNEKQQQQQQEKNQTTTTNSKKTFKLLQSIPKFCGRYRPLLQQLQREQAEEAEQKLMTFSKVCDDEPATTTTTTTTVQLSAQRRSISVMDPKTLEPSMDDALAVGTQMTRKFAERLASAVGKLQCSKLYTILTRTTQPAHLIAICILAFVLLTVGPDLFENHNGSSDNNGMTQTVAAATTTATPISNNKAATATETSKTTTTQSGGGGLATLVYLAAFATHFGAQIWMTFVSGLSLYFSLPRHTFGQCQQILFPKYFALNAMLSIVMLIIYVKYFLSNWTFAAILQLTSLALTAIIEVTVRLYLAPPMLRLMHEKYKIEGAIGSGQEVGSLVQGDLVQCPHYQRIHKGFRRIHMTIAIGNMLVMLGTFLHLYFLASKIRIS